MRTHASPSPDGLPLSRQPVGTHRARQHKGDTAIARDLIKGMGLVLHGGVAPYLRRFADRVGITAESQTTQDALGTDTITRNAVNDIESLRHEMIRRCR